MNLGDRLLRLRKHLDLSQQEMADKLLVSRPYLSRLERGKLKQPNPHFFLHLEKVEKSAKVPLADVLGER